MATTSLFGPTPAELILAQQKEAQQEQLLRNQMIAQQGAEFGPFRGLYQAGLKFGDIGAQALTQSMFPQQIDPRLKEATAVQSVLSKYANEDQTDPNVLARIGKDLMPVAPNAGLKALTLSKQLEKEKKFTTVAPGATVLNEKGEVIFTAPDREKDVKPSTNFAEVAVELGFGAKPNVGSYTSEEAAAVNKEIQRRKEAEKRAGVPPSGEVDLNVLAQGQGIVDKYTKIPNEKLSGITPLRTQLNLAKQGSGAAFEQVRGSLIKLVGDSQISNAERARITGSSGIIEDAVNKVQTLLQGVPTQTKMNEIERIIVNLEDVYANQFNSGLTKAETLLKEGKISPQTQAALLPSRYVSALEKSKAQSKTPAVGTIDKGYRFKGGNPADPNNWEKI